MIDLSEITEQKITEKYESLPQDLKDVLSSVKTSTAIESIAAKYRLNEEKTTMLIQLVGLVILGFASFENMKEEMKETIDISPQFIILIADEIRQKIFSPVINSLQKTIIAPTAPIMPVPATVPSRPVAPPTTPTLARPVDEYREPTVGPEVVNLRKAPPAVSKVEPPPTPSLPPKPAAPAIPPPLIEAEPHKIPPPAPPTSEPKPQYIMRPSGAPPTNLPDNVLDLRKDKGEF